MVNDVELDYDDEEVDSNDTSEDSGEVESTVSSKQNRQPNKVNLDDFEEFREFKSKSQKREAAAQRQAEEASRRLRDLEQQFHQAQMNGLDDAGKAAYENKILKQQLAEIEAQRNYDFQVFQWQRDMEEIATETGIPIEELAEAQNVHEAWRLGRKWEKANASKSKRSASRDDEDDDEDDTPRRRVDDRVDLGGGKPQGKAARYQALYDKARKSYDYGDMLEAEEKAHRAGVSINTW